jgi:hypothetical protein
LYYFHFDFLEGPSGAGTYVHANEEVYSDDEEEEEEFNNNPRPVQRTKRRRGLTSRV